MLAVEKFLKQNFENNAFPIPSEKGFIAYQKTDKKISSINFLFFNVETVRNSLSTYNFKFTTIEIRPHGHRNDVIDRSSEVDWENFYSSMNELKSLIKASEKYHIPETVDEASYLIWKSFVILHDSWFSKCFSDLPACFLESLNEKHHYKYRNENKREFISFLKDNYKEMYIVWSKYFEQEYCDYFCDWFHGYFYEFC